MSRLLPALMLSALMLSALLEGLGRLEEAEVQYREAIRLDDAETTWFANLAGVLRKRGRVDQAVVAYREAEKRAPEKW